MKWPTFLTFPRKPDFLIDHADGTPYMRRYYVIPRNRFFNIYLHNIVSSDDARALHDHPSDNLSILFRGTYIEHFQDKLSLRMAPSFVFRKAETPHRLMLLPDPINPEKELGTWSLFITTNRRRTWGFWCPNGWRPWYDFVAKTENGNAKGKGCD
jgi:hypothetical protein